MSDGLLVRVAGPQDAPAIAQLNSIVQHIHWEAHPDRFLPPDPARVEPAFRQWLDEGSRPAGAGGRSETKVWLCLTGDDDAVGYAVAVCHQRPETPFTKAQRFVELDQIAVRENVRSTGAGRLLARAVVEWARTLGVDTLELSVWQFNATAQSFFAGLGFECLWQRQAWPLS